MTETTSTTYNEKDNPLDDENFELILQAIKVPPSICTLLSAEFGDWDLFGYCSTSDIEDFIARNKINYIHRFKILFAKYLTAYDNATKYDVANCTMTFNELKNYVLITSDKISSRKLDPYTGIFDSKRSTPSSPSVTNKPPYIPPHKVKIHNHRDLKIENVNVSDLMKDLNISCKNLSTFLTFYQTLYFQLQNYNVFIRDLNDIDINRLSEPALFTNYSRSNNAAMASLHDFLKNTLHSFLSKDNVFPPSFNEGRNALSLTSDGYGVLNILLTRTHARMTDIWACDKPIPKYLSYNNLDDYCISMQEYFRLQLSCGRKYNHIEQTRMFLHNIDSGPTAAAKAIMEQLRGKRFDDHIDHHLHLVMLPGAITNHRSYVIDNPPSSNTTNTFSNQINSAEFEHTLCLGTDSDTDFIINAFRPFRNSSFNQQNNRNNQVRYNRSMSNRPFRGRCNACRQYNHHANNCTFLKKLVSCLSHMERNNISPSQLRQFHKSNNTYTRRSNIANTLQDENFIPYDQIDPDAFLNITDDIESMHITSDNEHHDT